MRVFCDHYNQTLKTCRKRWTIGDWCIAELNCYDAKVCQHHSVLNRVNRITNEILKRYDSKKYNK